MLSCADIFYGDAEFIIQQNLASPHMAKRTRRCLNELYITVLHWTDTRPQNMDELKAAVKVTCASITPKQHHRLTA